MAGAEAAAVGFRTDRPSRCGDATSSGNLSYWRSDSRRYPGRNFWREGNRDTSHVRPNLRGVTERHWWFSPSATAPL
ncbi:hypothetical protein C8039_05240 [Halogeometricum sp. wsp3]|nr:hypothetical protein C8039_05240 [Halogeometricum sp. wsp3]